MPRTLALIAAGVVANIVIGNATDFPDAVDVTDADPRPGPGWGYDGATFTPAASPAAPGSRRITKLDLINRLTDAEYIGILTAAKSSVEVEAWVKKLEMSTPDPDGTAIDLDDPRTIAGVQGLEDSGLIGPGRAAIVLS